MAKYVVAFSVEARHDFFDGACAPVTFELASETADMARRRGLVVRHSVGGLVVLYDADRPSVMRPDATDVESGLSFVFKAFATDARFGVYTEPGVGGSEELLYLRARGSEERDDPLRLHSEARVSDADAEPLDSPALMGVLDARDRLAPPVCVVDIRVHTDGQARGGGAYHMTFGARETYWKYYVQGNGRRDSLRVADAADETVFDALGAARLPNGRDALAFRSRTPIALSAARKRRFQLRSNGVGAGTDRVLIQRLPCAAADRLSRESIDGAERFVSEVFVSC